MSSKWTTRFGTLTSVTKRKTQAGKPYVTFELACKGFTQIGASFDDAVIAAMESAKGEAVWTGGFLESRKLDDGRTVNSYKATKFKIKALEDA